MTYMSRVNEKFLYLENLIWSWKSKLSSSINQFTWTRTARKLSLVVVKVQSTTSCLTLWRRREKNSSLSSILASACLAETRRSLHLLTRRGTWCLSSIEITGFSFHSMMATLRLRIPKLVLLSPCNLTTSTGLVIMLKTKSRRHRARLLKWRHIHSSGTILISTLSYATRKTR